MISSSRSFWKLRATGLCVTHRHTAIHVIYIYKYYIYICIYICMYVSIIYIVALYSSKEV